MTTYKSNLKDVQAHFSRGLRRAMAQISVVGLESIISETPEKTGNLKSRNSSDFDDTTATFMNSADYAAYVQFGTYKMGANPFFSRGLIKELSTFNTILYSELKL